MTSKLLGQAIASGTLSGNSTDVVVSSNGAIELAGNNTTDIFIAPNNNVGIGNTTPADALSVQGSLYTSSNTVTLGTGARFDSSGRLLIGLTSPYGSSGERLTVNGMVTFVSSANSNGTAPLYVYNTDTTASNNQPFIYFHDGSAIRGQIGCNYTDGAMWMNGAFGIRFRNNSGEIARFDSSGKLGIGTTTPRTNCTLDVPNAIATSYMYCAKSGSSLASYVGKGSSLTEDIQFYLSENANQIFYTNGSERMRISNSGNIGLSTISPAGTLDMGTGTNGRSIVWGGTDGTNHYSSIWTSYSTGGLVLATGYKGDTASDTYLSSYNSSSLYRNAIRIDAYNSNGIRFYTDSPANSAVGTALTPSERMRIDNNGNVGIGTQDAGGKTGSFGKILAIEGNDSAVVLKSTYGSGSTWSIQSYNGYMAFLGANSNAVRWKIDDSGRVTKPYQPGFRVYGPSANQGQDISFSTVDTGFSSRYAGWNSSTNTFTAPVAGMYLFTFSFLHNASTTYARVIFKINGGTSTQYGDTLVDGYNSYGHTSMAMVFQLAANDTVKLYNEGSAIYGTGYGSFSGFLIG